MNLSQRLALLASLGALTGSTPCALAQDSAPPPAAQPTIPGGALTTAELEEMLGPIALYPDELLANVLAASVYPDEVAEAANFMKSPGAKDKIDSRDWEPPVKAIAKVPDVLQMMAEFQDWTTALGQAYLTQAQDVMATIQTLRKKANANGSLISSEQQTVVVQQDTIYIQAADPEIIYVPSYEPAVVYVDDPYDDAVAAGIIGFGMGIAVGAIWADLDCDWNHGCVGWGDVDVDIDRNFNGDINIGNDVNIGSGNRNGNRVGNQGGAWAPNRNKPNAGTKPDARQNFKSGNTAAAPRTSSAARAPSRPAAAPSRAAGTPRTQAPSASRAAGASRTPTTPSSSRAQSAFSGGSDTRASSSRGSSSRQSAGRTSSGGNRSAGRGGGGGGGGGRGGGGRGGGRR